MVVVTSIAAGVAVVIYRGICVWLNRKRDQAGVEEGFEHAYEDDLTDLKVRSFQVQELMLLLCCKTNNPRIEPAVPLHLVSIYRQDYYHDLPPRDLVDVYRRTWARRCRFSNRSGSVLVYHFFRTVLFSGLSFSYTFRVVTRLEKRRSSRLSRLIRWGNNPVGKHSALGKAQDGVPVRTVQYITITCPGIYS